MTANEIIIAVGAVVSVAILAAGAVACVVVICAGALDRLAPLPCCSPAVGVASMWNEPDQGGFWTGSFAELCDALAEDERMEILRAQLDAIWEDDEDPRDAFADAALDYLEMVQRLPEVTS